MAPEKAYRETETVSVPAQNCGFLFRGDAVYTSVGFTDGESELKGEE